jgi:hypothetical protein
MWRTVLQSREVQNNKWSDAFTNWLGTPVDPFWWSTGSITDDKDAAFEEYLANIEGVQVKVTVATDDELPEVVDYHWPWVALDLEQFESLPYLPNGFDQLSMTLFKYSLRTFIAEREKEGKEVRVVLYWSPNGDYLKN